MRRKKNTAERRTQMTELFYTDTAVLRGERGATVYGCRRILHYAPERICLSVGKRRVCVLGCGLLCTSFCAGSVTVDGEVQAIRYCKEACHGNCDGICDGACAKEEE